MTTDLHQQIAGARQWYDRIAPDYRLRYMGLEGVYWKHFEEDLALELLGPAGNRALDLGCGPGRLASSLSTLFEQVVGVDISEAMVRIARHTPHAPTVSYCMMNATVMGFAPEVFDAVISLGMFEYLTDPSPFLREAHRVLKPGGRLIFTCYSRSGEGFVRLWELPRRVWRKLKVLSRPVSRAPSSSYYGHPADLRDRLYQRASHLPDAMQQNLEVHGFTNVVYRGFLFSPSTDLFSCTSRMPLRWLARRGMTAAFGLDRILGKLPLTRRLSTLAMFTARKA